MTDRPVGLGKRRGIDSSSSTRIELGQRSLSRQLQELDRLLARYGREVLEENVETISRFHDP